MVSFHWSIFTGLELLPQSKGAELWWGGGGIHKIQSHDSTFKTTTCQVHQQHHHKRRRQLCRHKSRN
jgi:hypothetical protein